MNGDGSTITIKLKNGLATYAGKLVKVPDLIFRSLKNKGEGGKVMMWKSDCEFNVENNNN